MAVRKKSRKKAKSELSEEKIVAIAFGITVVIIGIFMLFSNITLRPIAKEIKTSVVSSFAEPGELIQPFGIAISKDNKSVYVADVMGHEIKVFKQAADSSWKLEAKWGGEGKKTGQLSQPSGLCVDKDENVYVADAYNNRIQKFNPAGKYLSAIDLSKTGFWRPRNVMTDSRGIVYVANTGKYNIYRFNQAGQMTGDTVKFSGEIFGMAMDSAKRIFVANLGDRAVEVFDSEMNPLSKIKIASWIPNKGYWPMIAIDSKDRLYAVSELENQIYVFDTKDKKFPIIGVIKNDASKKPLFTSPLGITADSADNIYVTDKIKNRVVVLKPAF